MDWEKTKNIVGEYVVTRKEDRICTGFVESCEFGKDRYKVILLGGIRYPDNFHVFRKRSELERITFEEYKVYDIMDL